MDQKQYFERKINHELLNDIKRGTTCTKYKVQYPTEFRIIIYILRTSHYLSYREIIEYCDNEYDDLSPSLGHIKQLIVDGEIALHSSAEINQEVPHNKIKEDISVNNKGGFTIQSTESEREIKFNRRCELKAKMINNDVMTLTLAERRELWDLTTVGPAVAEYYMEMLNSQYRTNKRFINIL